MLENGFRDGEALREIHKDRGSIVENMEMRHEAMFKMILRRDRTAASLLGEWNKKHIIQ